MNTALCTAPLLCPIYVEASIVNLLTFNLNQLENGPPMFVRVAILLLFFAMSCFSPFAISTIHRNVAKNGTV
jgi:hypothetical protein